MQNKPTDVAVHKSQIPIEEKTSMSTNNPFNPFANMDFSKFDFSKFDVSKMLGDVKIPGFDMSAMMDASARTSKR